MMESDDYELEDPGAAEAFQIAQAKLHLMHEEIYLMEALAA